MVLSMDKYVVTARMYKCDIFRYFETLEEAEEFVGLWEEFDELDELRISEVVAIRWEKSRFTDKSEEQPDENK